MGVTRPQPRHGTGTQRGGQWRSTPQPDGVDSAEPLVLAAHSPERGPSAAPTPRFSDGTKATVRVGTRRRIIRYKQSQWQHNSGAFGSPVLRALMPAPADEDAPPPDFAANAVTTVVADLLADGDILPDPKHIRVCVSGCAEYAKLPFRSWPPAANLSFLETYSNAWAEHCALVELAAHADLASKMSGLLDCVDRPAFQEVALARLDRTIRCTAQRRFLTYDDSTWAGTDGRMFHRLVTKPIGGTTLLDKWSTLPDKNARYTPQVMPDNQLAPLLTCLLSQSSPDSDPVARQALSTLQALDATYLEGWKDPNSFTNHYVCLDEHYRWLVGVAIEGRGARRPSGAKALRALHALADDPHSPSAEHLAYSMSWTKDWKDRTAGIRQLLWGPDGWPPTWDSARAGRVG